jgi:tRNA threonylcarbamoyladenosine dehydratase
VAESNINRQVQASSQTVGMAKAEALRARLADIHPGCELLAVEAFVESGNWPGLLTAEVDGVIDACDDGSAKLLLARWALSTGTPLVLCGAAGGKTQAQAVAVDDLAATTHDPLLAALRQRLRKAGVMPRLGPSGLRAVFSREAMVRVDNSCESDGSLNCHGYGSSVMVTASFGMAAAGELLRQRMQAPPTPRSQAQPAETAVI